MNKNKIYFKNGFKVIYIFLLGIVAFLIILNVTSFMSYNNRINTTKLNIDLIRNEIQIYYKNKGHFPIFLSELTKENVHIKSNLKEYISTPKGISEEYDSLNGLGGWCYENSTGEIRINIIKPVKKYIKFYYGKYSNEVPSEW